MSRGLHSQPARHCVSPLSLVVRRRAEHIMSDVAVASTRLISAWVRAVCIVVVMANASTAAEPSDVGEALASNLPREFLAFLRTDPALDEYELLAKLNPYYLQGDFNGDGHSDMAIFLREKETGKTGLLIFHSETAEYFVLAAGTQFENRGDDFSRFDAWQVVPQSEVHQGADLTEAPPLLLGDALNLAVLESASGIIYFNGNNYAWY